MIKCNTHKTALNSPWYRASDHYRGWSHPLYFLVRPHHRFPGASLDSWCLGRLWEKKLRQRGHSHGQGGVKVSQGLWEWGQATGGEAGKPGKNLLSPFHQEVEKTWFSRRWGARLGVTALPLPLPGANSSWGAQGRPGPLFQCLTASLPF